MKILDSNILFNDIDCSEDDIMDMVIHRFEKETQKILKEIIDNKELFIKLIRVLKENYKIPYTQIAKKWQFSIYSLTLYKYKINYEDFTCL